MKLLVILSCFLYVNANKMFNGTIKDAMLNMHGLSKLVGFLNETDTFDKFDLTGPYTIFAPNNRAIHDLGTAKIEAMKNNTVLLEKIIKYHIVMGHYTHSDFINDMSLTSTENDDIRINIYKAKHVVTAEGCEIINFDNIASNGVIHVINEMMLPPDGRIADILAIDPEFSILYSLIKGTKFIDILNDNLLTLFAPNDAAFEKAGQSLTALQNDTKVKEAVLKYHIVHGILWTPGMRNSQLITLSDDLTERLTIHRNSWNQYISVNKARVINRDISADNGVIHTINNVLLPENSDIIG